MRRKKKEGFFFFQKRGGLSVRVAFVLVNRGRWWSWDRTCGVLVVDVMVQPTDAGREPRYIFHKRQRKVMALIPLKARSGIAALTFAAAVVPFVSATAAKATMIAFHDLTDTVDVTVNPLSALIARIPGEGEFLQVMVKSEDQNPNTIKEATGGIRFFEPDGNEVSDILQAKITKNPEREGSFFTLLSFGSDPNFGTLFNTFGFTNIMETGDLQQVGLAADPDKGIPDSQFRIRTESGGLQVITLPTDLEIFVESDIEGFVPGPVVGAGLPGLLAACASLFAWWRRRPKIS
jgi:hypothetical protein